VAHRPVAVITGASAGVGRSTAQAFAHGGFDVALLARGGAGLHGAAIDVKEAGGRPWPTAGNCLGATSAAGAGRRGR
jgi:NADP-dependent 3-hydroxy acid dehydrogenase YdfG